MATLCRSLDVELHGLAAQVDVAILQAHFFIGENAFAGQEWRLFGFVEQAEFVYHQFDFAGGNGLIERRGIALLNGSGDGDDVLITQQTGFFVRSGIEFFV